MKRGHVSWLFGFGPGVLLLLGAALALSATPAARAEAPAAVTYADPVGDANGGPDITQVVVSNEGDVITLAITVTGELSPDVDAGAVGVSLDTDENATTGYPSDGTDYARSLKRRRVRRWRPGTRLGAGDALALRDDGTACSAC